MSFADETSVMAPGLNAEAVTPNDGTDLPTMCRALHIGGAGDVSVVMAGGQTVTFSGNTAGSTLPYRITRVRATGTTATDLVAVW